MMVKNLMLIFIALLWSGFTNFLSAQENMVDKKLWSLKDCVDYALANNLNVHRSEFNVESIRLNYTQSRLSSLPSANASGAIGYNWGRGIDPVTNQFISSQRNNFVSLGVNGSVTLFNGFRIRNSIRQTQKDHQASGFDLEKSKNDVTLEIINLFINVLFNKELDQNARLQLNSSQEQLDRTKKQVSAGALSRSFELNAEAQVATNELNVVNTENQLALSLLQLQQALQLPVTDDFDVITPEIEADILLLEQSREEIFGISSEILPEMKSAKLKVESSYYAVKASRGNLYPRLSLNGSINSNYSSASKTRFVKDGGFTQDSNSGLFVSGSNTPVYMLRPTGSFQDVYLFNDQIGDNLYKSLNIQLVIPLFNGYANRLNMRRSMIANEQAKINLKETTNLVRQNVELAFNNAKASYKTFHSAQKQVAALEEAFRMINQRYEIGAASFVEYQVAENDYFRALSDLARARFDYIFKKKILDFYQGNPIEF